MTFADKTIVPGRQAASILELDLDACSRSYGVSPCTADLALQNIAIRTEDFSNSAWTKQNVTVTVNNSANPIDGAMTADEIIETTANGFHRIYDSYTGIDATKTYTLSYMVSKETVNRFRVQMYNHSFLSHNVSVDFDLDNQTVTGTDENGSGSLIGYNIDKMPGANSYYRVSITGIPQVGGGITDGVRVEFQLMNAAGTPFYVGSTSNSLYLFGAQLREGAGAGKYAPVAGSETAVDGMGEVDDLCFNTFGTCQDTANYLKEVRTLRFVDAKITRPVELIDAFPSITSVRYGSTRINPGGKFSIRGTVSVTLQDFSHNDGGVDDYQVERTYDPETQGTFFGKLKERNKYYVGRPMRVLEGYLDDPFDLANFRTREYIIENITGPTADGRVTITGKDILALARDDRAKAPTASTYTLRAAMTAGQTTLLPQVGEAVLIAAGDKHVRINDEIIEVVSESPTDTLIVVRGRGGTTGAAHAIDDSVQECLTYEDEPVIDVIDDLLVNFANIPSSYIPTTDWEAEEAQSLTGYNMETIISAPTGVTKLLQEICAITLIDLWYSDVDQEIKLKLQTPFTEVTETWTDDDNFVMDSVKVKDLNDQRLSRVLIYYGIRNYAEKLTEPENYNFVNFEIEADKEGVNKYDDEKIRTIFSRWFDSTNAVQVALTSQRLLQRFGITPIEITFDVDAKDVETLQTGDVYDADTRVIQDVDGSPKTTRFQIIETKPKSIGSKYSYKSLAFFQDPTPTSLIISANDSDYDVFVELGGPPGPIDVTLTLNTTIDVTATNGNPAITTVGMHPDSTLHFINNGDVMGYGGNAGDGRDIAGVYDFEPGLGCIGASLPSGSAQGGEGGDAIYATIDITIDNTNGNIWAGAGGGGGGGADATFSTFGGGGGGGGGRGTDTGNLGGGGVSSVIGSGPGCSVTNANGVAGTAGSTSAAGSGGAGGGSGGAGGAGGADWGDDGIAGSSGVSDSGGAGGAGGYAVRLNGAAIVWEGGNTAAKVKGDVA